MDLDSEIPKLEESIKTYVAEKTRLMEQLSQVDKAISETMGAIQAFESVRQKGLASKTTITY